MTDNAAPIVLDSDAVVWSADPADRAGRPLVVLMHGRGSNENDLISLAPLLPAEPVYASVRAPIAELGGWSWFRPVAPGQSEPASAVEATRAVLAWLDDLALDGIGIVLGSDGTRSAISAIGFSQGGAMTTQLLRHAPHRFASLVNLAGFSIAGAGRGTEQQEAELADIAVPVLWGRDPADPVIPADAIARTLEWLPAHSALTIREYPGIGHSVSREQLADVDAFLRETLLADAAGA
ncbi:alpha/beta hydrolase [Marisediminicola senii]|uniref:alpha/beta hydrolase n=1 Tax=Marisediminicola senii TaxID=2711233 RepID=UPI0013EB12A0|nr:dienelactone hydrolase family protein [Marisediminicola senii]